MHKLYQKQQLPISLDEAWDFFSSPANLKTITPDHMGFEILSGFDPEAKMYAGQVIMYRVRPMLGIPMRWVSEITHIEDKRFFIDAQREGPYAFWHHQHLFEENEGGTLMEDIIHYKVPLGLIGKVMNSVMVSRQLAGVFSYRQAKMIELFGSV